MLVIQRLAGEAFSIGDDVNVKVIKVDGDQVHIGIDAPRHIYIARDDIKDNTPKDRTLP